MAKDPIEVTYEALGLIENANSGNHCSASEVKPGSRIVIVSVTYQNPNSFEVATDNSASLLYRSSEERVDSGGKTLFGGIGGRASADSNMPYYLYERNELLCDQLPELWRWSRGLKEGSGIYRLQGGGKVTVTLGIVIPPEAIPKVKYLDGGFIPSGGLQPLVVPPGCRAANGFTYSCQFYVLP